MIILFTDEKIFASPHKKHVCTCIWNKKDITSKCFYTRITFSHWRFDYATVCHSQNQDQCGCGIAICCCLQHNTWLSVMCQYHDVTGEFFTSQQNTSLIAQGYVWDNQTSCTKIVQML